MRSNRAAVEQGHRGRGPLRRPRRGPPRTRSRTVTTIPTTSTRCGCAYPDRRYGPTVNSSKAVTVAPTAAEQQCHRARRSSVEWPKVAPARTVLRESVERRRPRSKYPTDGASEQRSYAAVRPCPTVDLGPGARAVSRETLLPTDRRTRPDRARTARPDPYRAAPLKQLAGIPHTFHVKTCGFSSQELVSRENSRRVPTTVAQEPGYAPGKRGPPHCDHGWMPR
jgi:hypothetical protein